MKNTIAILLILISLNCFGQDTTKAKQPHFLIGAFADFQLLYIALNNPDDVTKNQIKALLKWIESIKAMPEEKKEEKKPK